MSQRDIALVVIVVTLLIAAGIIFFLIQGLNQISF